MSFMAATLRPDGATIYADGAMYNPDTGVLTGIIRKAWPIMGMNAAFSSRGNTQHFLAFGMALRLFEFASFDDLITDIELIWETFDSLAEGTGEILIVGWSEKHGRPLALFRCTHSGHDGLPPGPTFVYDEGRVSFGVGTDAWPGDDDEAALAAVEIARNHPDDLHCGESETPVMGYSIGGHFDKIEVTADGVSMTRLREWPDVIGETIRPDLAWEAVA